MVMCIIWFHGSCRTSHTDVYVLEQNSGLKVDHLSKVSGKRMVKDTQTPMVKYAVSGICCHKCVCAWACAWVGGFWVCVCMGVVECVCVGVCVCVWWCVLGVCEGLCVYECVCVCVYVCVCLCLCVGGCMH